MSMRRNGWWSDLWAGTKSKPPSAKFQRALDVAFDNYDEAAGFQWRIKSEGLSAAKLRRLHLLKQKALRSIHLAHEIAIADGSETALNWSVDLQKKIQGLGVQ